VDAQKRLFSQMRPELADAPETRTGLKKMAAFLKRHLGD
jgi:hypothetical protein